LLLIVAVVKMLTMLMLLLPLMECLTV